MKIALQVCINPVYEELLTSGGIYVEYLKYFKKKDRQDGDIQKFLCKSTRTNMVHFLCIDRYPKPCSC